MRMCACVCACLYGRLEECVTSPGAQVTGTWVLGTELWSLEEPQALLTPEQILYP